MDFRFYEVVGVKASFGSGFVLKLAADQAHKRTACLEDLGDGAFKVLLPVEFKKGEKVGVAGDRANLNKAALLDLTEIDERAARKLERERKAEAQAKTDPGKPGLVSRLTAAVGLVPRPAELPLADASTQPAADDEAPV